MTTSREALRIEAEVIVPIEGLGTEEAITLFLARARAADRRLVFDDDAVADARRIVDALDGLPLAIELAAGRVRVDGLRAIAHDALSVVHNALGPRDRVKRSQAIGASIAWSVERLDPAARALFARLGAFSGTFDASDVAALDLDESNALDLLVDRSLAVRSDAFDVMLRLLSPVRADARARLEADPRRDEVLDAHAERIRANALASLGKRGGDGGVRAETRLDALAADIETALDRLFADDGNRAIDLVTALSSHWAARGSRTLGERWFDRADAHVRDDRRRGDIAYSRVRFAHDNSDSDEILRLGQIACDAYRTAGESAGEARALNVIGSGMIDMKRFHGAHTALARSLELQRIAGDEYGIAVALSNLAVVSMNLGDFAQAAAAYDECLPVFDRLATVQPRIKLHNNIAFVRMLIGDTDGTERATARAIALAEASGNDSMIAFAAANAAIRNVKCGDHGRALELARRVGDIADAPARYIGYALIARACVAHARGDEQSARRFASAARTLERDFGLYEDSEAAVLAPLPGDIDDAIDRDLPSARALLRDGALVSHHR